MNKYVLLFWRCFFGGLLLLVLTIIAANFGLLGKMPSLKEIEDPQALVASELIAEDGTQMGRYFFSEDRTLVDFKAISPNVIHCLIATEDERFYDHSGIDGRSFLRAIFTLGTHGGASTITQQLAKNLFTDVSRNWVVRVVQKIKEMIIAIRLEREFTKEEIISYYLNTVAFADNVYGVRNASITFFKKEPARLDVDEAAVLVGMLKGPTLYNPRRNPVLAFQRRNVVIDQLVRNRYLSATEAAALKNKPIDITNYGKNTENTGLAPYLRTVIGEELKKWCKMHTKPNGDNYNLLKDGLKIYTTINPKMQIYAEQAVAKHLSVMQKILNTQPNIQSGSVWKNYSSILEANMRNSERWKSMAAAGMEENAIKKTFLTKVKMRVFAWNAKRERDTTMTPYDSIKYYHQFLQTGFLAVDPLSGEIKAWVGGIDHKSFQYDHVNIHTKRQVGSAIKPLLYSLAVEELGYTPTTPLEDIQQDFGSIGKLPATAKTCTGQTLPMAKALALSSNCATAYLMNKLGNNGIDDATKFIHFLKKIEIQTDIEPYPSIALGACELSLFEMVQAFTMFAGKGYNAKPILIARIEDRNGNVLENFVPTQRKEVINEKTAFLLTRMMQGAVQFGTARALSNFDLPGEIAGKTGTTNDYSDGWFIGFTPRLLAGVWVGCDDRMIRFTNSDGQGSHAAMPIWAYFYQKVSADKSLKIDVNARFLKPASLASDVIFDFMNDSSKAPINEGEDTVFNSSTDYIVPSTAEDAASVTAESELPSVDTVKGAHKSKNALPAHSPIPKALMPKRK